MYPGYFDHAHSDYVEVAADTGLIGLGLWLAVGLVSAWRALRLLRDGQPALNRGVGLAAVMAMLALGLHGVLDFNLQIPANALTFSVLLALVWAAASPAPAATRPPAERPTP